MVLLFELLYSIILAAKVEYRCAILRQRFYFFQLFIIGIYHYQCQALP